VVLSISGILGSIAFTFAPVDAVERSIVEIVRE
jgi:hypothetical protein